MAADGGMRDSSEGRGSRNEEVTATLRQLEC
jgi:hypothetical protein